MATRTIQLMSVEDLSSNQFTPRLIKIHDEVLNGDSGRLSSYLLKREGKIRGKGSKGLMVFPIFIEIA